MRVLCSLTTCLFLFSVEALAEPVIGGATNAASFIRPGLPNSGLAQGGMATLFGTGLGPQAFESASAFPLPTELAGVVVKVHTAGASLDAIPVRVSASQTTVIIPSATPVGPAGITLTYDGHTSSPFLVEIVAHALGIFALNQGGSGPGIFTNASSFAVNTLFNSGAPGDQFDLWGVGLGAVPGASAGDERQGPAPGDLRGAYDVRVYVGGREAEVVYAGRSGCCAGLDQVRFVIPTNVAGCYVPVVVVVDGVPSNTVTISVSEDGGACSDPSGLTASDLDRAQETGGLRIGRISLGRTAVDMPVLGEQTSDEGLAEFQQLTDIQLIAAQGHTSLIPPGSCVVFQFEESEDGSVPDPEDTDPVQPRYLDAGEAINIRGPMGDRALSRIDGGIYSATLGGGYFGNEQPLYLEAGTYTIDNGNGGPDVGSFLETETLPEPLVWTNRDQISSVPGGQDLVVTWSGSHHGPVTILGASSNDDADVGAGFVCQADSATGRFAVPSWVVDSLPPSSLVQGFPIGVLSVAADTAPQRCDIPDLDLAFIHHSSASQKVVGYHIDPSSGGGGTGGGAEPPTGFAIRSSSFTDGGAIPNRHGAAACGGENLSPEIAIHNTPPGTRGYILLMDDPDAGGAVHWAAWNIPPEVRSIPEGNPGNIGVPGKNGFGQVGYTGPCPPAGEPHTYRIRLWALPLLVDMAPGTDVTPLLGMLDQIGDFTLGAAEYRGAFGQ